MSRPENNRGKNSILTKLAEEKGVEKVGACSLVQCRKGGEVQRVVLEFNVEKGRKREDGKSTPETKKKEKMDKKRTCKDWPKCVGRMSSIEAR